MRAPWKRAAILALATCSISVLPGCKTDVEKADEAVSSDIATATTQTPDKAVQTLLPAAGKGSPLTRAQSSLVLAQSEAEAAGLKLQELWKVDAKISGLLMEMERVGAQIASNNASISGFQALNPTAGQQAFDQVTAAVTTGDGGAWVKGSDGAAPVPAMADVKKRQENLGSQIAELTKQRTEITAKRATALQQAETFSRQADSTTGSASTAAYIQSSNLRKEAGDDEVKMRDLDAQILPLQQQLDVANEQQKSIDTTLASVKEQVDKLQSGWQGVQKQMDVMKEFSGSLVTGGAGAGNAAAGGATTQPAMTQPEATSSLNQLAAELNDQIKAAEDLRHRAVELLNSALTHLKDGEQQALAGVKNIPRPSGPDSKVPDKAAWQQLIDLNDSNEFKVRRANVLGMLARLYAGQYIELAQRNAVARLLDSSLKQAGVESQAVATMGNGGAPSPQVREAVDKISPLINKPDFDFAQQATELEGLGGSQPTPSDQEAIAGLRADLYYAWADSVANDVIGGNAGTSDLSQIRVASAYLSRMTNQYAWSKLGDLQGKAQDAKERLAAALSARKAISDNPASKGLLPPMLPPELAEVATTQPAGQPGSEAATTQPTTPEATTQPAPGIPSPGTASADTPDQAALRSAALALYDAIMSGDTDKARTMVVEDRIEFRTLANFMKAYADFQKAAADKFGDDAKTIAPPVPDMRQQIQTAKIDINGDGATLANPGDKDPQKAKRVGGVWKLDFAPGADAARTGQMLQAFNLLQGVLSRQALAIQSNKYKTAAEAKAGLLQEMKQSIPGFTPPPDTTPAQAPTTTPAGQ
jgi:hypothetical protein